MGNSYCGADHLVGNPPVEAPVKDGLGHGPLRILELTRVVLAGIGVAVAFVERFDIEPFSDGSAK